MRTSLLLLAVTCFGLIGTSSAAAGETYQVFILAGQSNMEGKASNALFEHQANVEATKSFFAPFRDDGQWIERDDVFIKFLQRHGPLTLGYGSRDKTGLELGFGSIMGDYYDEPVLLIKTAWGGHSLYQKFRPPSAGMPSEEVLQEELARLQERTRKNNEKRNRQDPLPTLDDVKSEYGVSYRAMMNEVESTLNDADQLFPQLQGKTPQIAGFVWFQGFNDMFGDYAPAEYEQNLKLLIGDIRKEWNAPQLPVVIGALGQNGSSPPAENMKKIQDAQLAMNSIPEFAGNVKTIRTDLLVDKTAEAKFPNWKDHVEEWKLVGSDRPYHYLGSAIWFTRIGNEMARTMIELKQPSGSDAP